MTTNLPRDFAGETSLWYSGTDVESNAVPKPDMMRPQIIIEKAPDPDAPACSAAPTHVTKAPMKTAHFLPRRSAVGPAMKT